MIKGGKRGEGTKVSSEMMVTARVSAVPFILLSSVNPVFHVERQADYFGIAANFLKISF